MNNIAIQFDDIIAASHRLKNIAHLTPVMTSLMANRQAGAELFFKCENFQRVGAFKFRGAYNAIAQFDVAQCRKGVLAFSSGNHAQAIALSAKLHNIRAVILMPEDAPLIKVQATLGYGAEVLFYDRYREDREAIGRKLAKEQGLTLIPPFDHKHIIAGQGTVAKELLESIPDLDILLVCLGGGGLISGCAIAAKAIHPQCRVVGVEPEAGNDAEQSFRAKRIIHIDTPNTIADGAQTQHIGELVLPILCEYVDDIVTVSDAQLIKTMKFFAHTMKMIVEPTGCLAAAAAFANPDLVRGKRVGIVVSGGNIDLTRFAHFMQQEI